MGISFSSAMLNTLLGYVNDLFTDTKLPILVLLGLMIGFFILEGISLALFRRKSRSGELEGEIEDEEED